MKTQKGFAVLEVVLILVILAGLGGVGWYVVNSNHKTTAQLNAAAKESASAVSAKKSSTSSKSSTPATAKSKFVFKELGVEMDEPASTSPLSDLAYTVKNLSDGNGGTEPSAYLGTAEFTTDTAKCYGQPATGDAPSFAAISKGSGQFDSSQVIEASLLKQFPDFYITISYPNGLSECTESGVDKNILSDAAHTLSQSFIDNFKSTATLAE